MQSALLRSRYNVSTLRPLQRQCVQSHRFRPSPFSTASKRNISFQQWRPREQVLKGTKRSAFLQTPFQSLRYASTKEQPTQRGRFARIIIRIFAYSGFFVISSGALVVAFFIYDASTYREDLSVEDIPVSELALSPKRGGPKNLPIASSFVDDEDSDAMAEQKDKPKLVILGTGWGSVSLLKTLNPADYHITVVSPVNYFLFTPMLPSATVGTLGLRSLVEPVRRIVQRVRGHFLRGVAEDVEFSEKLVEISQLDANGEERRFYLPYDKLVIGVGKLLLSIDAERYVRKI